MKVKVLEGGYMPTRAHFDDAGIDFRSPIDFILKAHSSEVVDLRVALQIPIGYYGEFKSKSGLNVKHNIQSEGGVVDSGFRGSVKARIVNKSDEDYHFHRGDKIVQMVFILAGLFDLEQADELDSADSGRNANGFGSTGI